jgi:nucleotide-binding universal stress UspA family protein
MFNHILVPTDGSELAEKAIKAAIDVAKAYNGKITALAVGQPYPYSPLADSAFLPDLANYDEQIRNTIEANVQKVAAVAKLANVQCEVITVMNVEPSDEIVTVAEKHGCDSIFMSSHGRRGIDRLLLGSVTQKVLLKSHIPVMVFR